MIKGMANGLPFLNCFLISGELRNSSPFRLSFKIFNYQNTLKILKNSSSSGNEAFFASKNLEKSKVEKIG